MEPLRYELISGSYRKQWDYAQRLADEFWSRWIKEFLPSLLPRMKWTSESPPIKIGYVVLICDNLAPRNHWKKGLVKKLIPGSDGRIRRVLLKTQLGELERSVAKIIRLDLASNIIIRCSNS